METKEYPKPVTLSAANRALSAALRERDAARSVQKQLVEALEAAEKAMGRILPYLIWTVGDESPGHHPTLPSAVGAFKYSLNEEVRAAILAAKASS